MYRFDLAYNMYRKVLMASAMQRKLQLKTREQKVFDIVRGSHAAFARLVNNLRKDFVRRHADEVERVVISNTFKKIRGFRNVMYCWMGSMYSYSINLVDHF